MNLARMMNLVNLTTPYAWDDSLSVFEMIGKLVAKINELIGVLDEELEKEVSKQVAEELKDFTTEKLAELLKTGELAQMILNHVELVVGTRFENVDQALADMNADLGIMEGNITSLTNTTNEALAKLAEATIYNIKRDVASGDITTYLETLVNTLGSYSTILIPAGDWILTRPISLKEGQAIIGENGSKIVLSGTGGFILTYRSRVEGFYLNPVEVYTGTICYLDNTGLNDTHKQSVDAVFSNHTIFKQYNPAYKSKLVDLYGKNINGQTITGFYNFHADNINCSGVSYPVTMRILDGWLHANNFHNWRVDYFEKLIVMNGQETGNNDYDERIRRNKFHNWTVQPRPDCTVKIFDQNKAFINDYRSMDIWDLYRWTQRFDIGEVDIPDWLNSMAPLSTYVKHGENYYATRVYPIATTLNKEGASRFEMHYYELPGLYADFSFYNEYVRIRASKDFVNKFRFYRDEKQNYWMEMTETAVGALYYTNRKNMGTMPHFNYNKLSDVPGSLQLLTVTNEDLLVGVSEKVTDLLNGHVGFVETYRVGKLVQVTAIVDSTNATAIFCRKIINAKYPGWGSTLVEGYHINSTSVLCLPTGKLNKVSFTYLAE